MTRKDTLKTMLTRRSEKLPGGNNGTGEHSEASDVQRPKLVPHVRSGAVGAMGRSLGQIANAAEQAKALVASGASVVEIPTEKLDASFVLDRLSTEGADFERLYEAIRDSGQKSPILVRPNPDNPERYQIAFGHRRVRVLAKLGRPVRAVVQNLSDEELVVIQGQENSARTDLSYIERGLFAIALEEKGFDRKVVMSALSMEKTQLSRLLSVVNSLPRDLILAIGPAPSAGRPRWSALAERLSQATDRGKLDKIMAEPGFGDADSDARFVKVFNAVAPAKPSSKAQSVAWKDDEGRKIATIERVGTKVSVVVDEQEVPEFGEYIASQLPSLLRDFQLRKEDSKNEGA